ncbi:MAG: hypothetical protein KME46_33530 [Brasilonema angustatum HA4187-MV1]|jgi:hypothetical protein|nr:hypothetical protein [Brasilonema angustatum HA4187-MV1]
MFDTQINSLENQIAEITARLTKFRSVESEFKLVAQAIAQLQENANQLSLESGDYLRGELAKLIGSASECDRTTSNSDIPKKDDRLFSENGEKAIASEPEITPVLSSEELDLVSGEELEKDVKFLSGLDEEYIPKGDRPTAIIEFLDEETRYLAMIDDEPTPVAVADNQWDLIDAIESVKCYDSAAEIAEALADEDEVDTHLMAIASILDCCHQNELAGRVWFFVQNVPAEFDDRILGYLPKSIRPEWDKQRTFMEEEVLARQSNFPRQVETPMNLVIRDLVETPLGMIGHITDIRFNAQQGGRIATVSLPNDSISEFDITHLRYIGKYQPKTEFKVNDSVVTPKGEVVNVIQVEDIGGRIYLEVQSPSGAKETYYHSDVKAAPVETVGTIPAPAAAATAKKTRKPKAKQATASEVLRCKNWEQIRAIANNDPKLIKEAATSAHTKAEKELIEHLPELIRDWCLENRNFDDLDWLPSYVVQRVRVLLSAPSTTA